MILLFLITIGAFALSMMFAGWRMRRACDFIIRDMKEKKAFDPESAVELSYSKTSLFHVGMRDYRPRALGVMVKHDVVRVTQEGRYYLREGQNTIVPGDRTGGPA
jgi:hypothetical protein